MKKHTKIALTLGTIPAMMIFFPWPWIGGREYAWIQGLGMAITIAIMAVWAIYDIYLEDKR